MPRSSFVLMLLGMLACAPAYAGEPRLFLSWHAPYGRPGASDRLWMDCQRMNKLDTLFMSFDPGVTTSGFTSFLATIRINALDGDTLSSLWDSPSATGLPVWMKVEWQPDSTSGCGTPFHSSGMGGASLFHARDGGRVLRIVYAVAYQDSVDVEAGQRYGLARILIRRPGVGPGCHQPVCIRWTEAVLSHIAGVSLSVTPKGMAVSLNATSGAGCAEAVATPPAKSDSLPPAPGR
ncbi:MAG: hypothetical protein E6K81_09665 [Candidatus Eisenbacteria bacterium]|uniref:Uncharacterized protein n=1 Tax=Eiseniibacteriota bacterium TaxID=2212470 RepID=A0A538U6T7_UNCEI|nr:MAG: hypothetical protein E6K81_09665 [Candidatus Eisenbacteria bacterium]